MSEFDAGIKDFKTAFSGRNVLVTGASRGIGRAIAVAFAGRGARVALCARGEKQLNDTILEMRKFGASREDVYSQLLDVSDESAIGKYLAAVRRDFGAIDILINNAGIYKTSPVVEQSSSDWRKILDTNLNAAFIFCRELAPSMKTNGWGRIINMSSISGQRGEKNGAAYSASKFGMIGLTQSLALELAEHAITVNAVCPGWVKTEMAIEQLSDEAYRKELSITAGDSAEDQVQTRHPSADESIEIAMMSVPQQRFIEPAEVAELVLYLASDAARGITGQSISICGGLSI